MLMFDTPREFRRHSRACHVNNLSSTTNCTRRSPCLTRNWRLRIKHGCKVGRAIHTSVHFPPSMVVSQKVKYFVRLYESFVALSVTYETRPEAYDAIAAYFKGLNSGDVLFVETQPTFLCYQMDGKKKMQAFVGPTKDGHSLASADIPAPLLPNCTLEAAGGELCACLPFSGAVTPASVDSACEELMALLEQDGVKLETHPSRNRTIGQYGPVYSLSERYNELILRMQT